MQYKLVSLTVFLTLLLTACDSVENIEVNNYNGQAIRIDDNVYVKKLYIQGVTALVYCDENGKIIPNTPLNVNYAVGRIKAQTTVLPTNSNINSNTASNKFQFTCSNIEDCYNEILIVKNSIKQ